MSASFDYYRTFYYVAKYKNFTRAATMLLSSQPSVTRSIQNLESELGCRLFIRSRHGVTLTPEGEMLYRYVAPACERILRGEEELGLSLGPHGGASQRRSNRNRSPLPVVGSAGAVPEGASGCQNPHQ